MGKSIKIGRLFGIDLKVHISFLLILVWGAFQYGDSAGPMYGILVTLALFSLVLLHELGHSLAAMQYGITVKDIILLPIGGVARLERMPEKPIQELVVAIAGPAVNVALAAMLFPVVLFLDTSNSSWSFRLHNGPGLLNLLTFLLIANIILVIFNMIPAFPLDGGRVFRAFLGFFLDYPKATKIAVFVGRIFALAMGFAAIFVLRNPFMALIAFFIFMAGGQEGQAVAARNVLRQVEAQYALNRQHPALAPQATVGQAASMMLDNKRSDFVVLDPITGQFLGVVSNKGVSEAMQRSLWHLPITQIMDYAGNIPKIALTTTLDEAQDELSKASCQVAAVYDGLNFKGLLTSTDIYRAFKHTSQDRHPVQPIAS